MPVGSAASIYVIFYKSQNVCSFALTITYFVHALQEYLTDMSCVFELLFARYVSQVALRQVMG
jgi:hypothetical protein